MEKMKKFFVFLTIFCLLSVPISAAVMSPQIEILDYVIYRHTAPINGYVNLQVSAWNSGNMSTTAGANTSLGVGVKTSYIMPNTFYRVQFKITQLGNGTVDELGNNESGVIDINNLTNLRFLPLREWENTDLTNPSVRVDIAINESDWNKALIPSDYVTAYWDHTLDTYYILFYIPEDFYDQNVELFMQTFLMFTIGNTGTFSGAQYRFNVQALTQAEIDDPIYNVLQEIKNNLASSGGGLSEEDIQNAVKDALDDHDQTLVDKVEDAIQDFADQVGNTFGSAISSAENIKNSLSNFANVFSYSGTDCVLTFPEARNPLTNNSLLWESQDIDIGQFYNQLPVVLTAAIRIVLCALIGIATANEVMSIIGIALYGGAYDG